MVLISEMTFEVLTGSHCNDILRRLPYFRSPYYKLIRNIHDRDYPPFCGCRCITVIPFFNNRLVNDPFYRPISESSHQETAFLIPPE